MIDNYLKLVSEKYKLNYEEIEEKIKSSKEIANRSFTNGAQSYLVTNSKYKIGRPISLAENDGRLK